MAKTPTRNPMTTIVDPMAENDDRCKKKYINVKIIIFLSRSFDLVDENSSENPLDLNSASIRPNEHAFFSDVTTMKELENDLTDLLQRFREGTLLAFSQI